MNPQSSLQQQYPLSPKKFTKKIVQKLLGLYILAFICLIPYLVGFLPDVLGYVTLFGLLILALITILYGLYIKTYIKRYYYDGEDHFITIKKGVFAPTEIHVQWQKIQDVYVDQDILDRIMGLYDVHIASATAASGIEAHIDGVEKDAAEGLKKFLLNKVSGQRPSEQAMPLAQTSQPQPARIQLAEEISSKTYPLMDAWLTIKVIAGTISSFIYFPLIAMFVVLKTGKDVPYLNGWTTYALIYVGVAMLGMIVRMIGLLLWKKNYAFNFTPDNIYYREGIISLSEKHMPYSSIQDVTVQQGVLERLAGLASVKIENAAQQTVQSSRGGRVSVFTGIIIQGISLADANKITDILKTTVLGKNTFRNGL